MDGRERTETVYYDAHSNFDPQENQGLDNTYERIDRQTASISFQRRDQNSSNAAARRPSQPTPITMPPIPGYEFSSSAVKMSGKSPWDRNYSFNETRTRSGSTGENFLNRSEPRPPPHRIFQPRQQAYDAPLPTAYNSQPRIGHDGEMFRGGSPYAARAPIVKKISNDGHGYYERRSERQIPSYQEYYGEMGRSEPQGYFGANRNDSSKHLYEEVPMSESNGAISYQSRQVEPSSSNFYGKETAILDDYGDFPDTNIGNRSRLDEKDAETESEARSAIYQPGNYRQAEDASSSSEEDDPEYLELMERETIINRYEQGPDGQDIDPWENPNYDLYTKLDRFGFVHKEGDSKSEAETLHKKRVMKELGREKKWLKMIEQWKSEGLSKKMEDRIWKGIPEKLRIVVWPRLLDAERKKLEKKDVYTNLLLRARLVSKDIKQIDLDINRTYRDHLAFRKRYDVKQKSLLNVLAAYSMYNTEVGYCQGMSQIVALFLMYLDEEEAFWCLHQLMVSPKHTMHGFFVPGFPKLSRFEEHFKVVLKKYKPRVYKHLEKQDIPYIYLTKWWFGCFLDRVPFSLALRLWDVFLVEGDPVLIAMAFNIMKMHEKTIRKLTIESFMEFIQNDIAQNFGYSDDETMHSLRETMNKLKSDRMHIPPPPKPEDLSEVPTKALGPILMKPMSTLRDEYHEIQSRKSRANSMGRSPYTKRRESAKRTTNGGPPPVNVKWNGNASQDSLAHGSKEVPFEIPTRRGASTEPSEYQERPQSKRHPVRNSEDPPRAGIRTNPYASSAASPQHLRDDRNGQIIVLSRGSDSDESAAAPPPPHPLHHGRQSVKEVPRGSKPPQSPSRITQGSNYITRIEIGNDDVSVI